MRLTVGQENIFHYVEEYCRHELPYRTWRTSFWNVRIRWSSEILFRRLFEENQSSPSQWFWRLWIRGSRNRIATAPVSSTTIEIMTDKTNRAETTLDKEKTQIMRRKIRSSQTQRISISEIQRRRTWILVCRMHLLAMTCSLCPYRTVLFIILTVVARLLEGGDYVRRSMRTSSRPSSAYSATLRLSLAPRLLLSRERDNTTLWSVFDRISLWCRLRKLLGKYGRDD